MIINKLSTTEVILFIKIGLLSLICIIALVFLLKKSYAVPSSECLQQMIKNTSISDIYIYSKLSKIRQIRITNPELKPIHDPEPPIIIPDKPKIEKIKSTWIGILHFKNTETEKPYIKIGQKVEPGDIVGHITSTHMETEIKSEMGGKIIGILWKDNSKIDFGRVIIHVEKT